MKFKKTQRYSLSLCLCGKISLLLLEEYELENLSVSLRLPASAVNFFLPQYCHFPNSLAFLFFVTSSIPTPSLPIILVW